LSISIEDILHFDSADYHDLVPFLEKNKQELQKKIAKLQAYISRIDERTKTIEKAANLEKEGFSIIQWQAPSIAPFPFSNPSFIHSYLENPQKTLVLFHLEGEGKVEYGYYSSKENLLRKKDEKKASYLQGLFWICAKDSQSNIQSFVEEAKKHHYVGGNVIGEYLLTAGGEKKTDYYLGKMELLLAQGANNEE
ncbi:MAG: hypothetical protein GX786_02315, partial [Clostridiales bacterium]|nr:hypothetical protein [Clostridiales bacterium]